MGCWFKSVCNKSECTEKSCIKWLEVQCLLDYASLPERYNSPDKLKLDSSYPVSEKIIDLFNHVEDSVKSGENYYIYSSLCETGKTFWACRLVIKYISSIWAGNAFKPRVVFIHVPTYLHVMSVDRYMKEESTRLTDNLIDTCDLVIWDDIGATRLNEYEKSLLLTKIDGRLNLCKSNIYTSNLNSEGLLEMIDARLASRVWNQSEIIRIDD